MENRITEEERKIVHDRLKHLKLSPEELNALYDCEVNLVAQKDGTFVVDWFFVERLICDLADAQEEHLRVLKKSLKNWRL